MYLFIKKILLIFVGIYFFIGFSHTIYIKNYLTYKDYSKLSYNSDTFLFSYVGKNNKLSNLIINGNVVGGYKSVIKTFYSNNGKLLISLVKKNNGKYGIVENNKLLDLDIDFMYFNIYFSPNGERYAVRIKQGGKQLVVLDGKIISIPDSNSISYVIFSKDSKSYAVVFSKGGLSYLYYNGKVIGNGYKTILSAYMDNGYISLLANDGNNYLIYSNGQVEKFEKYSKIAYSSFKNSFALADKKILIYNGKKIGIFDNIFSLGYIGSNFIALIEKKFKQALIINGKINGYYINVGKPKIADNGDFIYVANNDSDKILIYNGKEVGFFKKVIFFDIYKKGSKYAYIVEENNVENIYVNNKLLGTFNNVSEFKFLGNGKLTFVYSKNNKYYIYNGGKSYLLDDDLNNIAFGYSKVAYIIGNKLYENGKFITKVGDIKKLFYLRDALFVEGYINGNKGIYNIGINNYLNTLKEQRYIYLIKKVLGKKIKRLSEKRRKYIAPKVDIIIKKVINNPNYDNEKKIKKVTLFTAFKKVLLDFNW